MPFDPTAEKWGRRTNHGVRVPVPLCAMWNASGAPPSPARCPYRAAPRPSRHPLHHGALEKAAAPTATRPMTPPAIAPMPVFLAVLIPDRLASGTGHLGPHRVHGCPPIETCARRNAAAPGVSGLSISTTSAGAPAEWHGAVTTTSRVTWPEYVCRSGPVSGPQSRLS